MKRLGLEISMLRNKWWGERAINIQLVAVNINVVEVSKHVVGFDKHVAWHVAAEGATVCDLFDK